MDKAATAWRVARWLIVGVLVAANLAVFYAIRKTDSVHEAFVEALETLPEVEDVLDEPPAPESRQPMTLLVLGSDSRENLPDELLEDFGDFAGERADVIMLVQVMPESGELRLLSIPRDLRVDIDGFGSDKINAAYAYGGARLMVDTVRKATGLPIHHYLEVDFVGFAGLVDQLGGVSMHFDYAARDLKSGLNVDAGTQTLDGRMALAYARSRSYQELREGQWTAVRANDIGRTQRQQDLVLAILGSLSSPAVILDAENVIGELTGYVTVDPNFVGLDFVELGLRFRSLGSDKIARMTLPTESVREGGVWYEVRVEPDATDMLASFSAGATASGGGVVVTAAPTTAAALAPGDLTVQVLNGNGTPGAAGSVAEELAAIGFVVGDVGDADAFTYQTSVVWGASLEAAELVVSTLGYGEVGSGQPPDGYDAVVIVGADR